ncbi:ABC transporter substrate-binding protein [Occultella kanbiaonis]|uniref:ABC transporter substrate-binding protein n=1 Tax=Occultella kanbiaonis TaxID=2675754 RepID=UPI0013D35E97|nr:extracellular solute-binding protein [Occultella kanbiaonis]
MTTTRRQFLAMASMGAAGLGLAGCSRGDTGGGDGGGGGGGSDGDSTSLTLTWWGNPTRNQNTTDAIDAFTTENPNFSIEAQPGEWASYWDRLATQTAGNTAPDIIQMDMAYISEYGQRGALLDLAEYGLDTSKFIEGTADSGVIEGTNYGVNAGINSPSVLFNAAMFEELGVDLPDDTTWTWDDWLTTAIAITEASGGEIIGTTAFISNDVMLSAWLRQRGKELFIEGNQPGFDVSDITEWLEYHLQFADAGAMPSASQITEEASLPFDQGRLLTGTAAMSMYWSNQLDAAEAAGGTEYAMLRYPSFDGDATTRKAWYKASMLWSASARTENPEAAVEVINWWVNSTEAAEICLSERGIPANGEIAEHISSMLSEPQQRVAAFIADIEPELGDTPIAPPPGGGQLGSLLLRYSSDLLFDKLTVEEAATGFYDELVTSLGG